MLTPDTLTFDQPVRVTVTMPRSAFTRPNGDLALTVDTSEYGAKTVQKFADAIGMAP